MPALIGRRPTRGALAGMLRPSFLSPEDGLGLASGQLPDAVGLRYHGTGIGPAQLLLRRAAGRPSARSSPGPAAMSISIDDQATGSAARRSATGQPEACGRHSGQCRTSSTRPSGRMTSSCPARTAAGNIPALQAAALTGISTHAELTSGAWPAAPVAGQPVPVALPVKVAADLRRRRRLGAEAALRRHPRARQLARDRPLPAADPGRSYWRLDLIGMSGVTVGSGFASYGPAVVSPAAFSPGAHGPPGCAPGELGLLRGAARRGGAVGPADLDGLAARLESAIASLQSDWRLAGQHDDAADAGQRRRGAGCGQVPRADQRPATAPARGRGTRPSGPAARQSPGRGDRAARRPRRGPLAAGQAQP